MRVWQAPFPEQSLGHSPVRGSPREGDQEDPIAGSGLMMELEVGTVMSLALGEEEGEDAFGRPFRM